MRFILLGPSDPRRVDEIRMEPESHEDEFILWQMAEVGVARVEFELRDGTRFEANLHPDSSVKSESE
jgi:hypothetical protein